MTGNSKETTEKTTKENPFKAGGAGGPGRGHKKPHPIDSLDFWDSTEVMIREVLKSKDNAIRIKGIMASLKFQDLRAKYEAAKTIGDTLIDAGVAAALGSAIDRILDGDVSEVDEAEDQEFLDE